MLNNALNCALLTLGRVAVANTRAHGDNIVRYGRIWRCKSFTLTKMSYGQQGGYVCFSYVNSMLTLHSILPNKAATPAVVSKVVTKAVTKAVTSNKCLWAVR